MPEQHRVKNLIEMYEKLVKYSNQVIDECSKDNNRELQAYHKGIANILREVINDLNNDLL
ncbi:hypothetical protein [Altibacter sp. HG106]|uniref:hypothetical protein n=1 Tax=Altibacter sp. HG106 TaxID=3023937 RepID=UPI00235041F2|nr:hypothetical protein [Altibacter sp. HG106]MDC7994441.1 hypothetical protein [Altibacter sp. HG106]